MAVNGDLVRARRWPFVAGFAALALVAGLGANYLLSRRSKPAAPVSVPTTPAVTIPAEITLSGRLRARRVELVPAPIEGTLESVEVIEGQEVFEGQLLARIQNSRIELDEQQGREEVDRLQTRVNGMESQLISARLEVSRAEADATRASAARALTEKSFQRQQMLLREGATARLVFEKAEQEAQKAKADADAAGDVARQAAAKLGILQQNLDEAKRLLADKNQDLEETLQEKLATEVHAPVDGLIVAIKAAAGQEVSRETRDLFQIAPNAAELEFAGELPPTEASRIQPGQEAIIQVVESGNQPIAGKVKSVTSGTVVIEFEALEAAVKPGLMAQARILRAAP